GVCFFLGSVVLVGAHLTSGVINAATLPFSVAMVPAMALGMLLGLKAQDRLDQERFRRITLLVLCLAGLNLLRQGLGG
ncbi:MAG: TSUP family transporter, partial [Pseudomonadota bacterium]